MFKQENYTILSEGELAPHMENYIVTDSPPDFDISNITMNGIMLDTTLFELTPPQQQEETMDVAAKFEPRTEFVPLSPVGPPLRTVFPGELDFQVEINASDTHKRKYLYSNQLNRIYVDMRCNFSVQFRWSAAQAPMYVRATVVFSDESYAEKRVERCTQHTYENNNSGISQVILKNVLHSSREIGTNGVYYCGKPERADSWYSVLVEFPNMSAGPHTHAFQFVCKNSCPNGINRRAIDIIFNLEDSMGNVYGRQTVGARVCACPRRDMVRDELDIKASKKRVHTDRAPAPAHDHARTKKIKLETVMKNDDLVTLPALQIVGTRAVVTGLEVMLSMMEQGAAARSDPQAAEKYNRSIASLRSKIDEMRSGRHQ